MRTDNTELLINAVELLKKRHNVHINIHNICAFSSKALKTNNMYSFHDNGFCNFVKANEKNLVCCVNSKNALINKCKQQKQPFFNICYMGIGEWIFPVFHQDELIAVICIGSFCDNTALVYAAGKKYSLDRNRLDKSIYSTIKTSQRKIDELTCDVLLISALIENIYINYSRVYDSLKSDEILFRTIEFIEHNYMHSLTLELLAANCHCNPSYLSRQFKKKHGKNIIDYINLKRVEKAKELLSISTASVTETALECGFDTSGYFSQVFKKFTGLSPTDYRKLHQR